MRGILKSTLINTSIYHERAYERDSHKHANTSIYERAYERDSHKHANTSIYERAYERDSPVYRQITDRYLYCLLSVKY